ncbi:uncharacterized protein BDZ99DRAFT_520558 [Mytilinidion resinicola]|uniref:Low temperature requirement A n=1 Tax=Mytilinidion resinicola TaxID=574789 RepID=A0A6A6YPK0_9PEZI|nr:uncharacterized protein BDZ99DRAFT_520558 [Mytilinidion resinicola]KAF2810489.1 hypothetical protein BDZ99DRAFT_520558 [Mytilinidion resinicola]
MGFSVHGSKKREVDAQKHLKRLHKIVPWIENPLQGADPQHLVFHQRHEANTLELFFDLFFVANLATFTAHHSITDSDSLYAYIGFFAILWCSWFQITLHDVRFARDSIFERICKVAQFIAFVGLALVGSKFQPNHKKTKDDDPTKDNNTNFRILCYVLVLSRALLTLQYIVVLISTIVAKYKKLYLPLIINIIIYLGATVVFVAMTPAFKENATGHGRIYVVWYIVMLIESFGSIAISCCWTMLSFKKTHIVERMGLLTLIVIGEGAIGVTKTISKMMGKYGLDPSGCFLVICIILVLVFVWMLYFDNSPHGHYGTIRQQIWSVLHFPLHLAIVGLVEGSQQIALARYVSLQMLKIDKAFWTYCVKDHLDGQDLATALMEKIEYYQLDKKVDSEKYMPFIEEKLDFIANATGICSAKNTASFQQTYSAWSYAYPEGVVNLLVDTTSALYQSLGVELPESEALKNLTATEIMFHAWRVIYIYYWSSLTMLILCSLIFMILIRKNKSDFFDWISIIIRALMLGLSACLVAVVANENALYTLISSPVVLPLCLIIIFLILIFDRVSAVFANHRLKKSGAPYANEDEEHGHEEHDHHDELSHHDMDKEATVHIAETSPLTASTAYERPHSIGGMTHMPPALYSPPVEHAPPMFNSNGYAPVQNHG